jgi:hypothetical protein
MLKTLVYHVSEKTSPEFKVHMPDVHAVYDQILALNEGKISDVLLLPEYNAHAVWGDEASWIISNFQGIPVMIDCAGGWKHHIAPKELTALIAARVQVR